MGKNYIFRQTIPFRLGIVGLGRIRGLPRGASGLLDGFCGVGGTSGAYFVNPKTPKNP